MTAPYLVCPTCEHVVGPVDDGSVDAAAGSGDGDPDPDAADPRCPACGSRRAYRAVEPALPDAESEAYVKLDADAAEDR